MVDWAAVKAEFILHPEMNCAQIAEKYRVHHVTVRRRAAAEHWMEERHQRGYTLLQAVTQKAANQSNWPRATPVIWRSLKSSIRP